MFKGIGDEDIIGHKYETVDLVAYAQDNGLDEEVLLSEGVSRGEMESIKRLHELSTWKRETEHEYPSIDL
jgi:NH3-dependent NAD+ synthetase